MIGLTIYLDAVWLLNFGIDLLLIWLTAIVLKRDVIKWRLIVAGLIGSSIVLLLFTPIANIVSHPIIKVFFSMMIVLTAFGFKRFRYFFQNLLTFYFVTFVIGGGMVALHFLFQSNVEINNQIVMTSTTGFGHPISWGFVLLGFPLLWLFSKFRFNDIETKKIQYDQIVDVTIEIENISLSLQGLIDSGNQLYDPLTKTPVMIMDTFQISDEFPHELHMLSKDPESYVEATDILPWQHRIRLIPYRGVGMDHQFLLAVKPDKVLIHYNNEFIVVKHILVGLNPHPLSSDGDYQCILHPKMLMSNKVVNS